MKWVGAAVCGALLAATSGASAQVQSKEVPPSLVTINKPSMESVEEAVKGAAGAVPGAIVKGAGMLNQYQGRGDAYRLIQQGDRVGSIGMVMDGTKLLEGYARDGQAGLYDAGIQLGLDKAGERSAGSLVPYAVRRAVVGGVGGAIASGGAAIAFEGGVILGGLARDNLKIDGKSLGTYVDDFYFGIAPDGLKEWASGVKQVDLDSTDFWEKTRADVERRRRMQRAFEQVRTENEHLQAQVPPSSLPATPLNEPTAGGAAPWLDLLNQSLQLQQQQLQRQQRSVQPASVPPSASGGTCTRLDPKTGCHYGHDERSHPGGCKVC